MKIIIKKENNQIRNLTHNDRERQSEFLRKMRKLFLFLFSCLVCSEGGGSVILPRDQLLT